MTCPVALWWQQGIIINDKHTASGLRTVIIHNDLLCLPLIKQTWKWDRAEAPHTSYCWINIQYSASLWRGAQRSLILRIITLFSTFLAKAVFHALLLNTILITLKYDAELFVEILDWCHVTNTCNKFKTTYSILTVLYIFGLLCCKE